MFRQLHWNMEFFDEILVPRGPIAAVSHVWAERDVHRLASSEGRQTIDPDNLVEELRIEGTDILPRERDCLYSLAVFAGASNTGHYWDVACVPIFDSAIPSHLQ